MIISVGVLFFPVKDREKGLLYLLYRRRRFMMGGRVVFIILLYTLECAAK